MNARISDVVDENKVIIKPLAYYKMLIHVLRFGSKVRDKRTYKEVMGMLIGRLDGEGEIRDVIVEDAVPTSHGGSIEVAFSLEDYATYETINIEAAEKNMFIVGWYHSHPGLNIFFSSTDIKNQLGWQTELNPSGIGIVFDHTYLEKEKDLGFRTFRLDDVSLGSMSEYHKVETIVEPPDNLDFYFKIMEIINCIHSKEPPILEINETPDIFGEIIIPGKSQMMPKKPELDLTGLISGLQNGISSFIQSSFKPFIQLLNNWSQDIIKNNIKKNIKIRDDLVSLKDQTSDGLRDIQNSVKNLLTDKLYDLENYIDDRLEVFDKDQKEIEKLLSKTKQELFSQINQIFEEKVVNFINPIFALFEQGTTLGKYIQENCSKSTEILGSLQTSMGDLTIKVNNLKEWTLKKVKGSQDKYKELTFNKINTVINSLNELDEQTKEITSQLDDIATNVDNIKKADENQTVNKTESKTENKPENKTENKTESKTENITEKKTENKDKGSA